MDRLIFKYVTSLIKDDPIFYNNSNILQTPVHAQLHYALYKFGSDGNASNWTSGASKWGISEGHMYDYTLRVIEALCNLKDQLIIWPNQNKRKIEGMKNSDREGFLGAVEKLDGTDIVLKLKPGRIFKGDILFNRKKRYALDLCAVCDSSKRFTYILTGWPNSQHDARIFASTFINRNPRRYFSPGEYILGDAAYSNTSYLIRPYKSLYTRDKLNRRFNQKLSSVRVDIEHVFGMLKG